jgi:hypothetical protein
MSGKSDNTQQSGGSEKPPVPTYADTISSFKLSRDSRCSFITPNQQSTHHSAIVVKNNVPDIHACNPFCIDTYFVLFAFSKQSHVLSHLLVILIPDLLTEWKVMCNEPLTSVDF